MGQWIPPYYGKSSFYEKKKEKALRTIEKFQNKIVELKKVVDECDAKIAEAHEGK
jgi:prefoldin subunit 5